MHEPAEILSLRFMAASPDQSIGPHQMTFCYQCHSAVDLRAAWRTMLRSGHWARVGTCAHCGTTITRILRAS